MAVTYRSSGTIVANGDAGVDMSSSLPSGLAIDDIMIFVGADADNEHFDAGLPDGWAVIHSNNSSSNLGCTIAWKRYNGTESDWQFDTPSNAGQLVMGIIHAFSGCIKVGDPTATRGSASVAQRTTHSSTFDVIQPPFNVTKVMILIIEDNVAATDFSDAHVTVHDNQTTTQGSDGRMILGTTIDEGPGSVEGMVFTTGTNEYSYEPIVDLTPEDNRPTIVPNTADAHDFGVDDTPTLEFTGSDANDDDLEYQFQIFSAINVDTDKYVESNQSGLRNMGTGISGIAQSFTGDGNKLSKATFYLKKTGSPSGIIRVQLYAHTGTFGTSSEPTGSPLTISETVINATALTGSYVLTDFIFEKDFTLVNSIKYCIVIEFQEGSGGNVVDVGVDNTSSTHSGNIATKNQTTLLWTTFSEDVIFYIETHTKILDRNSEAEDETFTNTTDGGDTHPFDQPDKIDYTVSVKQHHDSVNQGSSWTFIDSTTKIGQSFIAKNNEDIGSVDFWIKKQGSPTGNVIATIYLVGTDGLPTGSAVATSNTVDVTTFVTSYVWETFTFGTPFTLTQGTQYFIVVEYNDASGGDWIVLGRSTAELHYGNGAFYDGSWNTLGTSDFHFQFTTTKGLEDGTFYWRAKAKDPTGTNQWSDWTTIRSFDIGGAPDPPRGNKLRSFIIS